MFGAGALAVHAHLTLANDAENTAAQNAREQSHEELIQARAGAFRIDLDLPDARLLGSRLWLGHLNLVVNCCF